VDVDVLTKLLSRYGVALNGLSNLGVDKLKKTCLPKKIVPIDEYVGKIDGDEDKNVARKIFKKVFKKFFRAWDESGNVKIEIE